MKATEIMTKHNVMMILIMLITALFLSCSRNVTVSESQYDMSVCKDSSLIKKELGAAGIRYARPEGAVYEADPQRDARKVPSKRLAARVEVLPYYHNTIRELVEDQPAKVRIPLRMHIGAPSVPVVAEGDYVEAGQLIAQCPDGALGSAIHASIAGRVVSVKDTIEISSEL